MMGDIQKMFNPKAVAFIGASDKPGSFGSAILHNLLLATDSHVFPINPYKNSVMDVPAFPDIASLPEEIDLAIIATPAPTVPSIVEECGKAGTEGVVIISSGFKRMGPEGERLEQEIAGLGKRYSMRIVGPDCLGIIRPHIGLNTTSLAAGPLQGDIAFISQSDAFGRALIEWGIDTHLGFSTFVSLGSMLDIDFGDLIDFLGHDPYTRSIMIYMEEGIRDVRKFVSAARGCSRNKPIVLLKPARIDDEGQASRSHTGYLATSDRICDAAFERAGLVRVKTAVDLFNMAGVLHSKNLPKGPRLLTITNAAGTGVMAVNTLVELGGKNARLSRESTENLRSLLPRFWKQTVFIDLLRDADVRRYTDVLKICLEDQGVDGVLVIFTPQGVFEAADLAKTLATMAREAEKPVITTWMGRIEAKESREILLRSSVPTYDTPEEAVRTYLYMYEYERNLAILDESPQDVPVDSTPSVNALRAVIRKSLDNGRTVLTDEESKRFLTHYGIRSTRACGARDVEEAVKVARSEGYPLVLKVASPDIIHKSDAGGVALGINSEEELRDEYVKMMDRVRACYPECTVKGVTLEKMIEKIDYEVILGAKKDKDFGPVILFGMGGVGVQIFRDFSIGLPPLNRVLARKLMEEARVYKLLQGYRGKPPVNIGKLEEILLNFSNLVADFPEIAEMDINPVALIDSKAIAVDARIILDAGYADHSSSRPHLIAIPYLTKHVFHWSLPDGTDVLFRPIGPEDEPAGREMLTNLSEKPLKESLFHAINQASREMRGRLSTIDYEREAAIIAEIREGGSRKMIGIGSLTIEPIPVKAEFDVVVLDAFQGKGLGSRLIDAVIDLGRDRGVREIYSLIMSDNTKMIKMCVKLGCAIEPMEGGVAKVTLALTGTSRAE